MTDKFKAQKLAKKGLEKGKAKGDGKKTEGQQKKGDKGKGKGTAANDRKCYICQSTAHLQKDCPKAPPSEKVAEIGELPPKKTNPRGRRGKLTAGDGDETFVLEEQFRNVKEQIQSHGNTTRVSNTVEQVARAHGLSQSTMFIDCLQFLLNRMATDADAKGDPI
jgi:hypothetical protein